MNRNLIALAILISSLILPLIFSGQTFAKEANWDKVLVSPETDVIVNGFNPLNINPLDINPPETNLGEINLGETDSIIADNHNLRVEPVRKTVTRVLKGPQKKDDKKDPKKDDKKDPKNDPRSIWYINIGTGPFGYPFNEAAYVSTGFFLTRRITLGVFSGSATVPSPDFSQALGLLADEEENNLGDVPEEGQDIIRDTTQSFIDQNSNDSNDITMTSQGLELKLLFGKLAMPIKLRTVKLSLGETSDRVLGRAFRLKSEYDTEDPDDHPLHDALDGAEIMLLGVGVSSRWAAKWGGSLEVTWISLEQAISQPKEIETVISLGLFGFNLGFQI